MSTISKWGRVCVAAVITFYMSSVCLSATSKDELSVRPTAKELVNLYKKAVTCWDKSVAMRVESVHSWAMKGTDETDIRHWRYDITHHRDGDRCEWFGRCQFKGELNGKEYSHNSQFRRIVGDDFFLYYAKRDSGEEPEYALMGSNVKEKLFILQAQEPDGGFLQGRMGGIGSAPKLVDLMSDCNNLKTIGQETLNGSLCHIVEAKTKYGTYTVWIASEKGYNALKYIVRKSGRDILRDDIHIEDQGITEWLEVVDSIDVQKIDGVFVPISGKLTDKAKAGDDWESTDHVEVKRSEIVLNPDFKALGAFKISFPEGTEVTHQDILGLRFRWTNGKFVPDMNKHLFKNLTGKPLPSFDQIITSLDPESTTGKMVLVCFFDMNQRPSRHCLRQLSTRAQELKVKDIVLIAVQSSKIDENTLNEWTKEQSISFLVGIVEGDEEEIRFTWGVKSLPWLILTDREHIVRAEGFALAELDAKIEEIVPAVTKGETRIIHFSRDRSVGMLYVLDLNQVHTSSYDDWQPLCEATGDVTVPAGKVLRLDWSKGAGDDLSPLSALVPNDLVILDLEDIEIADDQLQHIGHLAGLQELDLSETNILGTGLKHLARLKSLKKLWLANTHVGDNELAYLLDLPSLESLSLRGTPTNDPGMIHVGKMTSLEVLSLSDGVGDKGLAYLKGLKNLRWLSAGNRDITDEGLAHLAGLTQMENLNLEGTQVSNAGLVCLKKMTKLKRLRLYGTRVTQKGFVHLEGLQNLEELLVLYGVTDTGLMALSKLPSLRNITVDGDSLGEEGLKLLSKFKSLEHVYIDNTGKMDAIVKELVNLRGLKELTLGTGLTDEGLVKLKDMHSLQTLTIGPSQITGKGISVLAELPSLHTLTLRQAKLDSEDDWVALGKLSALQSLSLRHLRSEVTDAHVAHVTGLQSLKELSIDAIIFKDREAFISMDVTDKGLGYISKLKSLEHLSLSGAKITDEGLQKLSGIPGLKWMSLQGCNVTEQGLQRLKKKLPALRWFLYNSPESQGG